MRLCSAPCDKANTSFSSSEESSCEGYDRSLSLNQRVKHALCSLSTSPSIHCWPRSLYVFSIEVLCSSTQGSTKSMCCSVTRFALSKSASRSWKSTCIAATLAVTTSSEPAEEPVDGQTNGVIDA